MTDDPHWEIILRITLAAFLGGTIGFERDIHRRQAGLRTLPQIEPPLCPRVARAMTRTPHAEVT